jgi:hypothetical protein
MFCIAIYLRLKSLKIRQKNVFLAAAERIVVPTTISKQRRTQEIGKGRVSKVFVYKRFP